MPKERTYTDSGYLEVQWAKDGQLLCIVSAEIVTEEVVDLYGDATTVRHVVNETMHQFTDRDDLGSLLPALRRAKRQAFPKD